MADLFRKSLLEKLSSPEQLDKMIVITPPRFWIAMAGAGLMIGAALIWSVFGRLPENVDVQGVYVNEGGSYNVYSTAAGVIDAVCVEEGATVKKGDVIALLDSVELRERQAQYQDRIEKVQAVTIDSVEDVVTADNKNLIDIKNELLTANQTLLQDQASLELKLSELGEQRQKLLEAEEIMCTEEAWYYESINTDDSNSEQIDFSSAQNSLSTASSYLESAYASLDQAQVAYAHAEGNYQNMESKLNQIAAQKESLQKGVSETKKKFRKQYDQYVAAGGEAGLSITLENVKAFLESVNSEQYPELVQTAQKYIAAAEKEKEYSANIAAEEQQYQNYLEQYRLELDSAGRTRDNYQEDVNTYQAQKNAAASEYDSARQIYQNKLAYLEQVQKQQSMLSNEYNKAMSEYNSQKAAFTNLEDAVAQLQVQVKLDAQMAEQQTAAIYSQFDATKASIIDQLQTEYHDCEQQLEDCKVLSRVEGVVTNLSLLPGSVVQQGSVLAKVRQDTENIVVCYVPISSGKKITAGMKVLVYPTTVNKQEYGHMEASVEAVDPYVATTEELQEQLGNDALVESFLKNGPVIGVKCRLREDAATKSGYYWSSKKGSALTLAEGTLMEANVVVSEKQPITMLIPYIKEKLTLEAKGYRKGLKELMQCKPPCIIHWNFNHFVVWEGMKGKYAYINDPAVGRRRLTVEEVDNCFTGVVIVFEKTARFEKQKGEKTLFSFIRNRLKGQYTAIAAMVLIGVWLVFPGLVIPVFSQVFIDDILLGGNTRWITVFLLVMAFTVLFQAALTYYRGYLLQKLQNKMSLVSAHTFLTHLLRLPMAFFDQRYAGDLVQRVGNNNNVSAFLAGDLAETALNVLVAAFYLILLLAYSPILTLIGICSIVFHVILMKFSSGVIENATMKMQQDEGKMIGSVFAGLNITSTLKASGAENAYIGRIMGYYAKTILLEQKLGNVQQILNAIPAAVNEITNVLVMMIGGVLVIQGQMTAGMLVAYSSLLGSFTEPVNQLVGFIRKIQTLKADMSRVEDILKYEEDEKFRESISKEQAPVPMTTKLTGEVELKNIAFRSTAGLYSAEAMRSLQAKRGIIRD